MFDRRRALGPVHIPPVPEAIILTDRDDGTKWLISWDNVVTSIDNRGHITLNSTIAMGQEAVRTYGVDDGPKLGGSGEYSLIVRGGHLGLDYEPFSRGVEDIDNAPTFARKRASNTLRQLFIDLSSHHLLAWTDETDIR